MRRRITHYLSRNQGAILIAALSLIVMLFIGILVTTYIVAKRANPVFLDESGKPVQTHSAHGRN
jgi:hypothetical protein